MPQQFHRLSKTWLILLLAFAVALHALGARTFRGDELNSIAEAAHLGLNPNGILYFVIMHYWQSLGTTEMWLRVPAAFFAIATVAISYRWGAVLIQPRTGIFMALLMATAPFILDYAQQNRFYTFFLFAASSVYLSFALYLKKPTPKYLVVLILFNVLILGAHFFGLLVIISEILWAFLITKRFSPRAKWVLLFTASSLFVIMLLSTPSQAFFYDIVARWTNPYGDPTYTGARGISLAQWAKIPLTFFFFGFGEHVYPLNFILVVPGLLILLSASLAGTWTIWRSFPRLAVWIAPLFLMPVLLYVVFDPLSPPTLQGAGPRYLIFLIPFFYLAIIAGAQRKQFSWLIGLLLLVNLGGLWSYWFGDWAYTDDRVNWRDIARWASAYVVPDTLVLLDGQSYELAEFYFPREWEKATLSDRIPDAPRAVFISYNWHAGARAETTRALRALEVRYEPRAARAQYPFFGFILDRTLTPGSYTVGADGQVNLPNEFYGIEYQDLHLPFSAQVNQRALNVTGAFGLPRFDGASAETIPLAQPTRARHIILLSHLIDAENIRDGTVVASLKIIGEDERTRETPLRVGYETGVWDAACACRAVYTWRKRAALVGLQGYPGAWREFDAAIFASELNLDSAVAIRALEFERTPSPGKFYVWGVALEP